MKKASSTSANVQYFILLGYLALLSMLGFIATDMYLPAFQNIADSFDTSLNNVAFSLTTFLAGLAIGQLLYGPLVEKVGKQKALIIGLVIFAAASALIVASNSIIMLNIARFFQALGACSAGVIWQAIVVEKYDAEKAQKVFSNIMPLVALSPAVAPLIGASIVDTFGWRAVFITLAILAVLLIVMTKLLVAPENKQAEQEDNISYKTILKNTRFLGNVVIFGALSAAFFSYLTVWPSVMIKFGYEAKAIGLSFIPQTIMFIVGGYMSKVLVKKFGTTQALNYLLGLFFFCVATIAIATLVIPMESIYPLLVTFSLLAAANGATYPLVVNNALQQFSKNATKAAGLQNFLQIGMAFGASSIVAMFVQYNEVTIGLGIVLSAVVAYLGYLLSKHDSWASVTNNFIKPDPASIALHANKNSAD
ncbi:purine nucleoside transporter PunC [Shewanella sp. 3_MG-2023]|uniref:purine nucleoside transporter PunC n=1 Tax=Shewanella sp. 3_MG-2023 TaxID=3062635 RepID=UPI0026E12BA4|nr:purine nucleoside transporter PunC [Shewanella sp. 3_MG-2023]MDO6776158.1 purine nucleoside transporter PunC [Shewanella sp. 3_MG-2023]